MEHVRGVNKWLCHHALMLKVPPVHIVHTEQVTRTELKGIKEALEQQQVAVRAVSNEASEAELMFSNSQSANAASGSGRVAGPSLSMLAAANESSGGMSTGSNDRGDMSLARLTGSGETGEVQRSLLEMVMGRRAMSTLQV